jgi:cellulose synthase (UDP-forming)
VAAVGASIVRPEPAAEAAEPIRSPEPPPIKLLELAGDQVAIGAYDPHRALDRSLVAIEHTYVRQDQPDRLAAVLAQATSARLAMVTIEPFPARGLDNFVLDRIVAGTLDAQLRRDARAVREHRQVVLVRWGHEMELSGLYPWAANRPDLYRAAFRRVVTIFREEGASNARFVWSPAGNEEAPAYYPGSDVVDYVGITVLEDEAWDQTAGQQAQSFTDLVAPRYLRKGQFGKTMLIAELGVSGTPERQADWLADAGRALKQFPHLRALVYFNDANPPVTGLSVLPDWRVGAAPLQRLVEDVAQP